MKISRSVSYAIRALLELGKEPRGRTVPCRQLAAAGNLPERFLLQILRTLVNRGILDSSRGLEGGYTLERPLASITLLDVVEAIEGPFAITSMGATTEFATEIRDRIEFTLQRVADAARRELVQVTLANLCVPFAAPPLGIQAPHVIKPAAADV